MAERIARIGTPYRLAFEWTFDADTPNAITAAAVHVYDSAGLAIAGSPFTGTANEIAANVKYRPFHNLTTSGLPAGDYTGRFVYTSTHPIDDDEFWFSLLPVTSKFDAWYERMRRVVMDSQYGEGTTTASFRDYMEAALEAVDEYSKVKPRHLEEALTLAAGDFTYALPLTWSNGLSEVLSLEYPEEATWQSKSFLQERDYRIDEVDGLLYLTRHTPSAGQTARLLYTARHTLSHTVDTIPAGDFRAVSLFAAACLLRSLANRAAGTDSSALQAQAVNYRDVTQRYMAQADALTKQARREWRDRRVYL
jgi:hypothetical protein